MHKLLVFVALLGLVAATPSDNSILGDPAPSDNSILGNPEIECGPTFIQAVFWTKNIFEGHIYSKGLYEDKGCRINAGWFGGF